MTKNRQGSRAGQPSALSAFLSTTTDVPCSSLRKDNGREEKRREKNRKEKSRNEKNSQEEIIYLEENKAKRKGKAQR